MNKVKGWLIIISILTGTLLVSSCEKQTGSSDEKDKAKTIVIEGLPKGSIAVDGSSLDWATAGISPLEELDWKVTKFGKTQSSQPKRIKSVRIAHDGETLFLLLGIEPGVKEYFEQTRRSGHIGYIFLDADGNESTGARRNIDDKYPGWDYRVYLPAGFAGSTDSNIARPIVEYKIEKLKRFILEKVENGYKYDCEYEDVIGASKDSEKDPTYISFQGNFLEMCLPFEVLQMDIPTKIRLLIEDLWGFHSAEVEMCVFLK